MATRRGVLVLFLVLFVDLFHFVDLCFFLSVSLYLYSIYNSLTEEREGGRNGGRGAGCLLSHLSRSLAVDWDRGG